MKEDTPQGKSQKNSSRSRPQTEEDLDFEILDALENIEQAGKSVDESAVEEVDGADEFDVDLDEDLMFDEEHIGETDEFQIDAGVAAELGLNDTEEDGAESTELTGDLADFGLDTNLGNNVHIDENDDGSFSLDLDQDEEDFDLSFDDEIDLDLNENFEGPSFEEASFDNEASFDSEASFSNEDDSETIELMNGTPSGLNLNVFDASSLDMQGEEDDFIDSEESDIISPDLASQDSLDIAGDEAEDLSDEDLSDEDLSDEDDVDLDLDNLPDLDETMAEFNTSLDTDDDIVDTESEDMNMEQETDHFTGKGVISIDGDQVINLGDEDDIGSIADADNASWDDDDFEDDGFPEESIPEESGFPTEETDISREEGGEFMASLDDIQIDLHDEDAGEEPGTFSADVDVESLDLPEEGDSLEGEEPSEEDFEVPSLSEVLTEVKAETGITDSVDVELSEGTVSESKEELQEAEEPEVDVREALGLVPRLLDEDITKFEQMVLEAKTLQQYIEELEEHKPEIKTKIYHKLLKEYSDRKADIFREPEFISIRIDVEQDLEDMLRKRDNVHDTMSSLHDELEEVQVRHLVGEYTDEELSAQEISRKADIDEWQQKSERLEEFITQYQELLETEKVLNPAEEVDTHDEEPVTTEDTELGLDIDASAAAEEEISEGSVEASDLEAIVSDEADETPFNDIPLMPEEDLPQEEDSAMPEDEMSVKELENIDSPSDISMDDLSEEIEGMEDLTGMLDSEDRGDWENEGDEELEFTAESFDDDALAFGDELTGLDEEDFELDEFSDDVATEAAEATAAAIATEAALDGSLTEGEDEGGDGATDQEEDMVSCKKCGRSTPASEKFCVNCGGKAQ